MCKQSKSYLRNITFYIIIIFRKIGVFMKTRTISGFFIVLILTIAIIYGNTLFVALMGLCSLFGFYELTNTFKKKKINYINLISYILVLLITLNNTFYNIELTNIIILMFLLLGLPIVIYNDKNKYNFEDFLKISSSILLLGIAFNTLIYFRNKDIYLSIYIFLISFITDTYAYIGGRLIGRTKLTNISPKKTIEGSLIGTIMAMFIGSCYYNVAVNDIGLISSIVISLLLSIISQFGDLFFSSIKRYYDKKDYSNLIPGHGGILDRLDSVIFVTLLLKLLICL